MRAVALPERTKTASPWPMSQAARSHDPGRSARPSIGAPRLMPTGTRRAMSSSATTATRDRGRGERSNTSQSASAVHTTSSTAPAASGIQGNRPSGSAAAACATSAIQLAGTHATWRKANPTDGNRGSRRHPMSPATVPTGAAGAASRFAGTPYSAIAGSSRMRTGWQASWAASGTPSTIGERRRHHACEGARQGAGEQQQSRGRAHRERESVVARVPRVDAEQHDDGDRERGRCRRPVGPTRAR